ncbi:MAG: DUF4442 domain-containing protein [Deltaproteobacteria bacterium]|nr:DUF4442 domain-containing protein [Deltaproteobacteria bacterium]
MHGAFPVNSAFDLIEHIHRISPYAARAVYARLVPRLIPLAGGLKVRIRELSDMRCEVTMPATRRSRNHLGTMYFGAQMTLIDLTVGILLFRRFPPGPFGGVIKRVEAEFHAKAKGTIRCVCEAPVAVIDELEQVRTCASGKVEGWVPAQLLDKSGTVVTEARVLVAVKRFDRR